MVANGDSCPLGCGGQRYERGRTPDASPEGHVSAPTQFTTHNDRDIPYRSGMRRCEKRRNFVRY